MQISDIIQSDHDRLFIVDYECFIIFTGDTLDDDKPFIRIGNWINLPVDIIPFIENIIITDGIIGIPSYEQFNIDVRYLSSNRYIGSKHIIKRFLDYQKMFGIDLTNVTVVDIEKDIPELSKEKNISKKNHFIGVFYRDGNYKTVHNNKTIIDLNQLNVNGIHFTSLQDRLSKNSRLISRYSGAGLVVIEDNPLFYCNKNFVSYLFPNNYFSAFSLLGIDPEKIREIIFPSTNMLNISKFLKWKNGKSGRISMFSDHADHIELLKNLFSSTRITEKLFSNLKTENAYGCEVQTYPGTFNVKINYKPENPTVKPVSIAFIKGSTGVKKIITDKVDAMVVTYSIFEDINLLLRSSKIPVAVIDDGSNNVSRINPASTVIIRQGIQYDFRKHDGISSLYALSGISENTIPVLIEKTEDFMENMNSLLAGNPSDFDSYANLYNSASIIKAHILVSKNRKISAALHAFHSAILEKIDYSILFKDPSRFKIILNIFDETIIQSIARIEELSFNKEILLDEINESDIEHHIAGSSDLIDLYFRIINDRKRLRNLLDIYINRSDIFSKKSGEIALLKKSIQERKDLYLDPKIRTENFIAGLERLKRGIGVKNLRSFTARLGRWYSSLRTPYRAAVLIAPFLIPLLMIMIFFLIHPKSEPLTDRDVITKNISSKPLEEKQKYLTSIDNSIEIGANYIFEYANKVAIKNGYRPIMNYNIRFKNPNWIYPQNIFIMLDGEKITVREGDTIWELARLKLVEMTIKFNKTIKKIKSSEPAEHARLTKEAKSYAFAKEHFDIIDTLVKTTKDNADKR